MTNFRHRRRSTIIAEDPPASAGALFVFSILVFLYARLVYNILQVYGRMPNSAEEFVCICLVLHAVAQIIWIIICIAK